LEGKILALTMIKGVGIGIALSLALRGREIDSPWCQQPEPTYPLAILILQE
jgi:hypothetical protein